MRPSWSNVMLTGIALFGICLGNANAQHQNSGVTMTLGEFEELFSSARLEDAERRSLDQRKMQEAEHQRKLTELEEAKSQLDADVTSRQNRANLFPDNFQILRHTAAGVFNASSPSSGVERDVATFSVELTLRIMEPRWTVVPLINTTSMVASNWAVAVQEGEEFLPIDTVVDPNIMLVIREEQQVLATNASGLFRITFDSYARISKTRTLNALGISSLLYPLSEFSLRIASDTSGSLIRDLSVQPSSAVLQVVPGEEYTDIGATLPLTADSLLIKWLDVEQETLEETETTQDNEKAEKSKKGVASQVTASHDVIHTIGEGVIRSKHVLDFSTTAAEMSSLNSVQFIVHGNMLRVTSVVGHALQSWTVEDVESSENHSAKLVKVAFKSSHLDSTVTLHVNTEMDLEASELGKADLPRVECIGVLRQLGHVAVTKEANVEVHEHEIAGLSRIDASDMPSQLRLNSDRPIVLGFRYLNSNYAVTLEVQEHATIDTLEATVDRVHYKAQVTDTHTIHSMMLIMQSTKLQYLELNGLPATASMFTVLVNSHPTKPVEGKDSVLVPLLVGLDTEIANAGGNMKTSVELTYISKHEALGNNGTIQIPPPLLTLPVSVLTVHLRLPETYMYEFSGSFGDKSAAKLEYPIPSAFSHITGKRVVEKDHKFTAVDDLPSLTEDTQNIGAVKFVTPRTGRSYYFSRLFVVDSDLALSATYSLPPEKKQTLWSRLISRIW